MIKLFLDTNILLKSLLSDRKAHLPCLSILLQNNIHLVTSEYVLKEVRKILGDWQKNQMPIFNMSNNLIN